jgi:hypothetical protein
MQTRKPVYVTLSLPAFKRLKALQRVLGEAQLPCPLVKVPYDAAIERLLLDADLAKYQRA